MSARMTLRQLEYPRISGFVGKGQTLCAPYLTSLIESGNPDPVFETQVGFQMQMPAPLVTKCFSKENAGRASGIPQLCKSRRQIVMQELQAEIDATKPGQRAESCWHSTPYVFGTRVRRNNASAVRKRKGDNPCPKRNRNHLYRLILTPDAMAFINASSRPQSKTAGGDGSVFQGMALTPERCRR